MRKCRTMVMYASYTYRYAEHSLTWKQLLNVQNGTTNQPCTHAIMGSEHLAGPDRAALAVSHMHSIKL